MKRRVCETCYFFEPAGINNSGWCRHPERQFAAGVRLVVRGNEIACRNGWDVDLWVPAGIEPAGALDEPDDVVAEASDRITSIVPARYEAPVERPASRPDEDVVVHHVSHPAQHQPAPDKDARDLVTNPRAAILRAREQFKVRQKREGRIADQVDRPILRVDATDDFPESDWRRKADVDGDWQDDPQENAPFLSEGVQAPRPPAPTVAPVPREDIQREDPTLTFFPEDAERFDSIPPADHRRHQAPSPELIDEFGDDDPSWAADSVAAADDDYWAEYEQTAELTHQPRREPFINRFLRKRRDRHEQQPIDDRFDADFPAANQSSYSDEQDQYAYAAGVEEEEYVLLNQSPPEPVHDDWSDSDRHAPFDRRRPEPAYARSEFPDYGYATTRGSAPPATLESDPDWVDRGEYEARDAEFFEDDRFYAQEPAERSYGFDEGRDYAAAQSGRSARGFDERRRLEYDMPAERGPVLHRQPRVDRDTSPYATERQFQHDRYDDVHAYDGRPSSPARPEYADDDIYADEYDEQRNQPERDDAYAWGEDVVIDPVHADHRGSRAQHFELPRWQDDAAGRSHLKPEYPSALSVAPIAAEVPRICRTCRDFRPSESEDRGWCNNPWAFKHRRMVDADTLSCGSSALGSWWTPSDAVWQRSTDVSRHAQETPLLDRLLASRYEPHYESGRRAGGSGER